MRALVPLLAELLLVTLHAACDACMRAIMGGVVVLSLDREVSVILIISKYTETKILLLKKQLVNVLYGTRMAEHK